MVSEPTAYWQTKLRTTVEGYSEHGYSLLDGAQFEDLPALLTARRLFSRSLYLDTTDAAVQAAGPWLVALGQKPGTDEQVLALIGERPAAVFWHCDKGETVLWQHLRSLNTARIPQWMASDDANPAVDDPAALETVFFRHYDPRVLNALMPHLHAAQFSRIMGPAREVAFGLPLTNRVRRIVRDPAWPPPAPGLLTISGDQVEHMAAARTDEVQARVLQYLRKVCPEKTRDVSDADLMHFVRDSHADGTRLGLETEQSHCLWAYLNVMSDNQISNMPHARRFVTDGPSTPDVRVQLLIEQIKSELREMDPSL